MKTWIPVLLLALVCIFSFALALSCGDDDDDDDGGWSCGEACSIVYDDCYSAIAYEGYTLSESECVEYCEELGGLDNCMTVCFDNWEVDKDCEELDGCIFDCFL